MLVVFPILAENHNPDVFPRFPCMHPDLLPIFPILTKRTQSDGFTHCLWTSPLQHFTRRCCLRMQRDIDIKNISQLRQFVSRTLCQKNDFEEGVFQVTEKILTKCGKLCGVLFCLHGPRSIKLTAVWDTDTNSILFYGSTGERFKKILIPSGLNLT